MSKRVFASWCAKLRGAKPSRSLGGRTPCPGDSHGAPGNKKARCCSLSVPEQRLGNFSECRRRLAPKSGRSKSPKFDFEFGRRSDQVRTEVGRICSQACAKSGHRVCPTSLPKCWPTMGQLWAIPTEPGLFRPSSAKFGPPWALERYLPRAPIEQHGELSGVILEPRSCIGFQVRPTFARIPQHLARLRPYLGWVRPK